MPSITVLIHAELGGEARSPSYGGVGLGDQGFEEVKEDTLDHRTVPDSRPPHNAPRTAASDLPALHYPTFRRPAIGGWRRTEPCPVALVGCMRG